MSKFTRTPNSVFENNKPYTIIVSHNEEKGIVIHPEVFRELIKTETWEHLCNNWSEKNNKPLTSSDKDLLEFREAIDDSLERRVTKQKSPQDYIKKIRDAA